jgi:transposase
MAQQDPTHLVFVDELGAQTTLTPLYGRAPAGERVEEAVPADCWHTTTLEEAVRLGGPCAPMQLAGPLDACSFRVWVERLLLPCLRPGDIVIWDNLPAHHAAHAEAVLAQVGARLKPLPAYSPDLNPIEPMGGKIKAFLRRAKARTARALTRAIAQALATITPEDIQGWFAHCGYRYTVP